MSCILLLEHDRTIRDSLSQALTAQGFEIRTAQHGPAALAAIAEHQPTLVLLNRAMPAPDRSDFLRAYDRMPGPSAPILALDTAGQAIPTDGAAANSFDVSELTEVIELVYQFTTSTSN